MSRSLTALAAAIASLAFAVPAQAAPTADSLLVNLAQHQTHGWADVNLTTEQLAAKINQGEHIFVPCGTTSFLAEAILRFHGHKARVVQGIAAEQAPELPTGIAETHVMLEVWTTGGWVLYDVDGNVQPTDAADAPISALEYFATTREQRHYRRLADDPEWEPNNTRWPEYEARIFADVEAFHDRIFATLAVYDPAVDGYYYSDSTVNPFVRSWAPIYQPLSSADWTQYMGTASPAPAPVATPAPVVPLVESGPAVAPAAPVAKRPCQRKWRRYQRTHTRRALKRYKRCRFIKVQAG